MISRSVLLPGIWLLAAVSAAGAGKLLEEAADDFYNLDFDQALAIYEQAAAASPNDAEIHNHVAHTLLYRELFRNGALESEMVTGNNSFIRRAKLEVPADVDRRFTAEVEKAMAISQNLVSKNPRDTHALHALAVSYALRA